MRNKLALTMALASFGVFTALGVGFAGAEDVTTTEAFEAVAPLSTTPAEPTVAPLACSNELDDDNDGLVDSKDPDCTSPADTSEETEKPSTGTSIEAQPAPPSAPTPPPSSGVEAGTTIDGTGNGGGVRHNNSIGDASGGGGNSGGGVV